MRYWVYINDKVDGPYDETNLVTLEGFTPDTLICSEEVASNGGQEWVKASSVFEFDEVPVNELAAQPASPQQPAVQQPNAETNALLAQLEALTNGMSSLQSKLDAMQHNLDSALEQNKKLSDQVAQLSRPAPESTPIVSSDEPHTNTITLTRHDMSADTQEKDSSQEEPSFPQQAAPEEEEVIIRSALDSIYGGKPVQLEDTFQDLLPEKTAEQEARKKAEEEQAVHNIEPELEFIPVQEDPKTEPNTAAQQPVAQPEMQAPAQTQPAAEEEPQPLPAEALDEIEKELTFMSLEENKDAPQPETTAEEVKEAIITTPGLEETAKDALINELTASPKEDILDQIIAEHQQTQTPATEEESHTEGGAMGAAAAGLAAASLVSLVDNTQAEPMAIATDKENPEKLEEVLPAEQMPADVPAVQPEPEVAVADLPSVAQTPEVEQPTQEAAPQETTPAIPVAEMPEEIEQPQEAQEAVAPEIPVADTPADMQQPLPEEAPVAAADLPGLEEQASLEAAAQEEAAPQPQQPLPEEELQELVPADEQPEPDGFYVKEEAQAETLQEEASQAQETSSAEQEPAENQTEEIHTGAITDKDLQDAFGSDDTEPVVESSTITASSESLPEGNPNELTEIELKEGSTYLISDFVPPAQLTDNVAEVMKAKEEEENKNKKQETIFQDMLATTKGQSSKVLSTDGLPDDLSATQINLENTIQAKRGAALDIKTVPMVPEPEQTERLDVNELNDVNAQHGLKTSGGLAKSTKTVIMALVGALLLIILYVLLGMMKLLPPSFNLFTNKQQAPATTSQELLSDTQPQPVEEAPQGPTPAEQAQEKVQNFPLPNGMVLKAFIESKHTTISPELITWETTEAVEADSYSVTVKVPPENPQNFKTVYRFNYNTTTGLLDPTVSDAKNLLDQAYGIQPATPATQPTAQAATKTTTRNTTRRTTNRKRTN